MTSDPRTASLAAYWRFFAAFNSREPASWADALNFPHVRVSGRAPLTLTLTRAEHERAMNWNKPLDSGWHHSVGAEPQVLHVSPDVVHICGGWTRFTEQHAPIMSNQVTYIITRMRVDGIDHWGMQARFGIDPGSDSEAMPAADEALALVDTYLDAWNVRDYAGCAALLHYPAAQVLPGEIVRLPDAASFSSRLAAATWHSIRERTLEPVQTGPTAVNVAIDMTLAGREQAVFLVTRREGRWGIEGRSIIEAGDGHS